MKRLFVSLLALAGIGFAGLASADSDILKPMVFTVLKMRNTAASTVARDPNWATVGQSPTGFADSSVFRRAGTRTSYDTSAAFFAQDYPLPPNLASLTTAFSDTLLPWIMIRVEQDSVRASVDPLLFSGTTSLDSIRVAIEHSPDGGRTWFTCSGTPTYRFDTVFMTSGQDGTQSPTLIGVESIGPEDSATIPIQALRPTTNAYIVNKNVPYIGEPLRIIVGAGAATGQLKLEIGHWQKTSDPD